MISPLRATGFSLRTDPAWGYLHRGLSRCSPQRVPIRRCQAQKSGSELALEELQASQSFSTNRVATVRSWGFLGACTFVAAASLFSFNLLSQEIVSATREQGYTGAPEDLLILDLRDGYTPETAFQALKAWGGKGIRSACLQEPCQKATQPLILRVFALQRKRSSFLKSELASPHTAQDQEYKHAGCTVLPFSCISAPLTCRQSFIRPDRGSGRHLLRHSLPRSVHGHHQQAALSSVRPRSRAPQIIGALSCCAGSN
jgi:hypothetical protein